MLAVLELPIMSVDVNRSDEEALVARLKERDKTAMEDLVRLHGARLYGVAMQIVRNETEAEEVLQEALI